MTSLWWNPLQALTKSLLSAVCFRQSAVTAPLFVFRRNLGRPVAKVLPTEPFTPQPFRVPVGKEVITVETIMNELTLRDYIQLKTLNSIGRQDRHDPFYVVNLGSLIERYSEWFKVMPLIQPFYAVKSNPDPMLLKTMAALGSGFDCASMNELKLLLGLGVPPDRLIYANPNKQLSHLQYSAERHVNLMTFDGEAELYNIKNTLPSAQLLLRIRADDPDAFFPAFGTSFGASVPEACHLVHVAKGLGLNVVGVAFHVSSLSQNPGAYSTALKMAADVFEYAHTQGYRFSLLDIGGGYPGYERMQDVFQRQVCAIREGLANFKTYPNLRVISEPGYYFACPTQTLAVSVIGKKVTEDPSNPKCKAFKYYVNDGLFGSFLLSGLLNLHLFQPSWLKGSTPKTQMYKTCLMGPTCASIDKICETIMPELSVGDWIYFNEMGGYTTALATEFNGFPKPRKYYYVTERYAENLIKLLQQSELS